MRFRVFLLVITVTLCLVGSGYFYIQVLKGKNFYYLSEKNRIRIIPQASSRGKIIDRNGLTLVTSRISFNLLVSPRDLQNKEKTISVLSGILGLSREKIRFKIDKACESSMYQPSLIFEDISKDKAFSLEEKIFDIPGIMVEARPIRNYPYDKVGSHIFGYLGEVNKAELEGLSSYGYRMKDLIGRSGLEKYYNFYLKGEDGGMQVEVDNLGRRIKTLGFKVPKNGNNLELTIDFRLQYLADKAMENKTGAAIGMNPKTGEILFLSSSPEFDPNIFIDSGRNDEVRNILQARSKPLLNRAVSAFYPPGSVFKIVTATAGLETGKIKTNTTFNCAGKFQLGNKIFKCWDEGGHGGVNIFDALKFSCNVYFYNSGRAVGVDELSNYAAKFGYGKPTGIDLPEENPGILPNRMWKIFAKNESWYEGETINYAIGQGALTVTPIQVLRMVSGIADNGEMAQPYIVKKIGNVDVSLNKKRNLNISQNTISAIKEGLGRAVQDPSGTGKRANVEGLSIAGKTGTAQAGAGKISHGWFAGFAPLDDPKLAIVVLIEHGGKGGLNPAEIAGMIFKEAKLVGYL